MPAHAGDFCRKSTKKHLFPKVIAGQLFQQKHDLIICYSSVALQYSSMFTSQCFFYNTRYTPDYLSLSHCLILKINKFAWIMNCAIGNIRCF